jgi:hypothetical protein
MPRELAPLREVCYRCVRSHDLAPPLITEESEIAPKSPDFR